MVTLSVKKVVRGRKCYVCNKVMIQDEVFMMFTIGTHGKWGNALECDVCVDCINKAYNELCNKIGETVNA
jgi:hypothetical protein